MCFDRHHRSWLHRRNTLHSQARSSICILRKNYSMHMIYSFEYCIPHKSDHPKMAINHSRMCNFRLLGRIRCRMLCIVGNYSFLLHWKNQPGIMNKEKKRWVRNQDYSWDMLHLMSYNWSSFLSRVGKPGIQEKNFCQDIGCNWCPEVVPQESNSTAELRLQNSF